MERTVDTAIPPGVSEAGGGREVRRVTRPIKLDNDDGRYAFVTDAVAAHPTHSALWYLSVAGPGTAIKALRATLHMKDAQFRLNLLDAPEREGDPFRASSYHQCWLQRAVGGYETYSHPLGYGVWHMVAITKTPGFMTSVTEEAVWRQLNSPRFTTPVLRDWCPYILDTFLKKRGVLMAKAWGCSPGLLGGTSDHLDEIVKRGLKSGAIAIR